MTSLHTEALHSGLPLHQIELERIASLIYDTDPFIYPALFSSRQQALRVISKVLPSGKDAMFKLENCFIIRAESEIVGLLLWHKGPLMWRKTPLISALNSDTENIAPGFHLAAEEYISLYDQTPPDVISIINVCVEEKAKGKGIGKQLMRGFIRDHCEMDMELCVLTENFPAISLYKNMGFQEICQLAGFSEQSEKPACLKFFRRSDL